MTARAVGLALIGLIAGLIAGFVATLLLVWLWFDGLGLHWRPGEPKEALAMMAEVGPWLMLASAVGAAVWLVRRDRVRRISGRLLAVIAAPCLPVVVYLVWLLAR